MEERTSGIVIRVRLLTETSLIVHWLTRDFGRIATVAKGARRTKSPFHGKLDLFYLADLSFRRSLRSELHTLCEVNVSEFNPALRCDLAYVQQAAYFITLLERITESEAPVPILFELLKSALAILPHHPAGPVAVLAFEIKLLVEQGLQPDLGRTHLSPGSKEILLKMTQADWRTLSRLRLTAAQTGELRKFLHDLLVTHFDKVPPARSEALNVAGRGPPARR